MILTPETIAALPDSVLREMYKAQKHGGYPDAMRAALSVLIAPKRRSEWVNLYDRSGLGGFLYLTRERADEVSRSETAQRTELWERVIERSSDGTERTVEVVVHQVGQA